MTRAQRRVAPLMLTALGVPVDLHFRGPRAAEARAAFASRWSLCARAGTHPDACTIQVSLGEGPGAATGVRPWSPVVSGADLAQLMVDVTHEITFQVIDANIGSLLMFHAAGVCNPATGAAVVCVAAGGTGKTTLCRTLGPGRGYLSDETVGVSGDGTLVSYPKPLSLRRPDGLGKDEVDPTVFGLTATAVRPYVTAILLLDRTADGPDVSEVVPLDAFDAIIGMTPETSSLSRLPRPLHRLAELVETLPLVARVHYRESSTLEPVVAELIGPPGAGAPDGRAASPGERPDGRAASTSERSGGRAANASESSGGRAASASESSGGRAASASESSGGRAASASERVETTQPGMEPRMRVRRVPVVDELQRGVERLVMVRDRAVRLVGVAPAILDLTEDWRTIDELTTELERRFGAPPEGGADKLVQIAVSDLASEGLVEVVDQ